MLDIAATIIGAYAFVWRERLKFAWLAGLAVLGLTVFRGMTYPFGAGSGASPNGNATELGVYFLLLLLATQFAVAWHRHQLLPDEPVPMLGTYRLGRHQRHYLFLLLGLSLLTAPIFIGARFFSFYAAGAVVDLKSPWFQAVAWLISLPLLTPALLILARLTLCFPAVAIDRRMTLKQGWQRTRGFGWALFSLILLAWGPAYLFSTAAMMLATPFASLGTALGKTLCFLLVSLGHCLFFLATAVLATTLSMAYRLLVAEPEPVIPAAATPALPPEEQKPAQQQRPGMGKWLVNALVAGLVLGGAAFVAGFFVYPLLRGLRTWLLCWASSSRPWVFCSVLCSGWSGTSGSLARRDWRGSASSPGSSSSAGAC